MPPDPLYSLDTRGELHPWQQREWLLTNGLGAFAMSSVVGCNIRRYHGLLCAARMPPVGRVMALSRLGEIVYLDGDTGRMLELSVNQFRGNVHPRGDKYLRRFHLGETARWEYDVEGVRVTKALQLLWRKNVAGVRYTADAGQGPGAGRKVRLDLLPFTGLRDFHALRRAGERFDVRTKGTQGGRQVIVTHGDLCVCVEADAGRFVEQPDWWYEHVYPIESERGQDDHEDLFCPGRFTVEGEGKLAITLWASIEPLVPNLPGWDAELARRVAGKEAGRSTVVVSAAKGEATDRVNLSSAVQRRLDHAASDFIVYRRSPDGSDGTSILAGYPWFADWGRDTFISLPGLLLKTRRFEQARQVLTVFGHYVSEGMIPNRFDDYSNEPHYNTVDASLWYVHSAFEYLRLSGDDDTFAFKLLPACRQIIDGYKRGTRYHIKMEADGLVTQGDATTQLTWMDAKHGDTAFTPRQGKAVEINALWYHALMLMAETELANHVAESFRGAFWISPFRGLADVVTDGRQDTSIRPNQIFAVSLPHSPLDAGQQQAVVEVVRRELLTPYGLRTLARSDPKYCGRYCGDQWGRDSAYHNGTVWPWPLGAFLEAYLKVNRRSPAAVEQARKWLRPLIEHMEQNCIGQIAEIFEAEEPHRPAGCPAQAWSVAEVLRMAVELQI
jgi:predicted glycogen debranching enzyme